MRSRTDSGSALVVRQRKQNGAGYLFIGPWLISFLAFTAIPFVASFALSFTDYNMLSNPVFVGFANYIRLFSKDRLFLTALTVTFKFVFTSIPLRLIFALMVAMILKRDSKAVPFYRVIYYLPSILGGTISQTMMDFALTRDCGHRKYDLYVFKQGFLRPPKGCALFYKKVIVISQKSWRDG